MDYNAVKLTCNEYFSSLPFPIVDFSNERFFFRQRDWGGSNVLFRARHINNEKNTPHENVSDISFIPENQVEKIKCFGRVNKPYESMFYGSLNFPTACTEAISKGNVFEITNSTMLTVGVWEFVTPLKLVQIPHSEKYFELFYKTMDFKSETIQIEHIKAANEELRKKVNSDFDFQKLMFFADQFAKWDIEKDCEYMLSNYFADRVLNRIPQYQISEQIDGIMYPSIALSYQEMNIVLKPEVVREKMKFLNAMQIWTISFMQNQGGAQFIPLKQKIRADEKGNLLWNSQVRETFIK